MPNPIKYNASAETLSLQKGNFWIGTGAVGKGPTSTTGYYNGITPPSGGYTIYLNKASGGPSIYCPANDASLISLTNSIAGAAYTTAQQCFNYYYTQTDKMCLSQDYPADFPYIVLDDLVLYVDAGVTLSYPGSGTTWADVNGLGPKNNGTLTNGPTYSSANGGSIVFDGVDDYIRIPYNPSLNPDSITVSAWINRNQVVNYSHFIGLPVSNTTWNPPYMSYGVEYISTSDTISFVLGFTNNSYEYTNFTPSFGNNQWFNFTGTYDKTNVKIYINGVLSTTRAETKTMYQSTSDYYIGTINTSAQYPLNGRIGSNQVYSRALTAAEVLQNYNAQKSRFGL